MATKLQRRQRIKELLASHQVTSQEQLQELLRAKSIAATQATLSRDLREMRVVKGPAGYQLSETAAIVHRNGAGNLARVLPSELLAAEVGGNLLVLRTQPAHANPLAIEIDRAGLPEIIGTIAGDDAVFVATKTGAAARRIARTFRKMAGLS